MQTTLAIVIHRFSINPEHQSASQEDSTLCLIAQIRETRKPQAIMTQEVVGCGSSLRTGAATLKVRWPRLKGTDRCGPEPIPLRKPAGRRVYVGLSQNTIPVAGARGVSPPT